MLGKPITVVARHGAYISVQNGGMQVEILTRGGVKEAQALLHSLQEKIPEYNGLQTKVYSSPSPRTVQTAMILTGEEDICLVPQIGPGYGGIPEFAKRVVAETSNFELVVIMTHMVQVGMLTAALLGKEYKEDGPYGHRSIGYCDGFLIKEGKATKI